tara:strand:+ start:638 stop:1165 length:528 start_codon:yes stop_codon:yes gene_type:complete
MKKKYIQKKDKKKLCPVCTTYIFNATVMCYGINSDGNICNYMHKNKKTSENNRKKINKLNNKIELNKIELKKIELKKIKSNKNKLNKNKSIKNKSNKNKLIKNKSNKNKSNKNKSNKNIKIEVNQFIPKYNYSITKKNLKKNFNFIIETNKIKKKLFDKKWQDNIFDNLKEIENI